MLKNEVLDVQKLVDTAENEPLHVPDMIQIWKIVGSLRVLCKELTATDKCDKGVFIAKWSNASIFDFSEPPLPQRVRRLHRNFQTISDVFFFISAS